MWMMGGYNEGVDQLNLQDYSTLNATRRLRPLLPKPSTTTTATAATTPSSSSYHHSCLGRRIHAADLLAFNHHQQGKREYYNSQQVLVSSRWNPTPEQLLTLEELYQRGTRTPSAEQIQQITAQLRRYGKIEGKNVFYWFQNHKARERQKRRRQVDDAPDDDQQYHDVEIFSGRKEPGANRTGIEVQQMINRSWALTTSCCTSTPLADQRSATLQMSAAKAAAGGPECTAGGCWVQQQFHEREEEPSHERIKNSTWQQMQLPSSSHPQNHHHILNPTTTTTTTTTPFYSNTTAVTVRKLNPNLIINNTHHLLESSYGECLDFDGEGNATSQTLELFPLRSGNNSDNEDGGATLPDEEEEKDSFNCSYQFFEFLPMKN